MSDDPRIRDKWLAMLAKLVSPSFPEKAAEALQAMSLFLDDVPGEAFTLRSLEAVVASPRRQSVPSLDELRKPLLAWWRDNHPRPLAIPYRPSETTYSALPDPEQVKIRAAQSDEILRKHGMHSLADVIQAREARVKGA